MGKTTSFNKLYELMKNDTSRFQELFFIDMTTYLNGRHSKYNFNNDFYCKFEERNTKRTIVLFSMGDYYYEIKNVILKEQSSCDILICALNNNVKNGQSFFINIDKPFKPSYIDHNYDVFNIAQANKLLSII